MTVDAEELVVGDIVDIPEGDNIPADCVCFKSQQFMTNESGVTGEPEGLHKEHVTAENYPHNPDPFLLQNTLVEKGTATAIVLAVGHETRSGKADRAMKLCKEPTPL